MKNNNRYIAFAALILITLFSCSKPFVQVVNIKEARQYDYDANYYALPKTVLEIEIDVKRTIVKCGPYCDFAEKYLSIKDAPKKDHISWNMGQVRINSKAAVDTNHIYLIKSNKLDHKNLINLTTNGIIVGINNKETTFVKLGSYSMEPDFDDLEQLQFTDWGMEENFNKGTEKKYKRIKKDSTYVRVPILQSQISKKNLEEKAKEAAHFIVKLRKRRFKLISGMYDKFYSGPALEIALKELERQEEEYLSLFIGKRYEEEQTFSFAYTPDEVSRQIPNMICRFSAYQGIINKDSREGSPILIEMTASNETNAIADFVMKKNNHSNSKKKKHKKNTGLCYRLPEQTTVRILNNKTEIATATMLIPQFGIVNRLSPSLLIEDYIIEFNSEYGNIIKIKKNNE